MQLPDMPGQNRIGDDSLPPEESDISRDVQEIVSPQAKPDT